MKKVIGIISYLPEDKEVQKIRFYKLLKLINSCNYLFNLPFIIIAQNYSSSYISELVAVAKNIKIYNYPKLGITGARHELRSKFLASEYDYLIMLDDDCEVAGISGQEYLKQIENNPNCFIEFKSTLLKLFAISKTIFKEVDYENIEAENGDGFEDRIFVNTLRIKFPDARREFQKTGLTESSISTNDPLSTWYKKQDLETMINKTNTKLLEIMEN